MTDDREFFDNPVNREIAKLLTYPDYRLMLEAQRGVREPLAKYIEDGGDLCPETRQWLAAYLRGEASRGKPGPKRTSSQWRADMDLRLAVRDIQAKHRVSENRALKIWVKSNPRMKFETARSSLKRAKKAPSR